MPDIITTNEMSALRNEAQKWYTDVCSITREVRGDDPYGGETETPSVIATGVPCDVGAQAQVMRPATELGGQVEELLVYRISLPPDTLIQFHDRITITSRTPNRELVVQSVLSPESLDVELMVYASVEGEPLG